MEKEKLKFGTKEWSDVSINILKGDCPNKCVVCYARANNSRYGSYSGELVLTNTFTNKVKKYADKVCMYPTTHDIFEEHLPHHYDFLKRSLDIGNRFLIVSKGKDCLIALAKRLVEYREQIEFRISVSSLHEEIVSTMEPNAPIVLERLETIKYLAKLEYKVSLSIEPFLGTHMIELHNVVDKVGRFATGNVWIGFINHGKQRASLNGQYEGRAKEMIDAFDKFQTPEFAIEIYNKYRDYDNIKFKESIMKHIK